MRNDVFHKNMETSGHDGSKGELTAATTRQKADKEATTGQRESMPRADNENETNRQRLPKTS